MPKVDISYSSISIGHKILNISIVTCINALLSRLTIVSREAKKKQKVCNEPVSYLHIAPL